MLVLSTWHGEPKRERSSDRARQLRECLSDAGFSVPPGDLPIIPVFVGDAKNTHRMVERLFDRGILATAFTAPVVPIGRAHIRLQVSVAHTDADIATCVGGLVAARAGL